MLSYFFLMFIPLHEVWGPVGTIYYISHVYGYHEGPWPLVGSAGLELREVIHGPEEGMYVNERR